MDDDGCGEETASDDTHVIPVFHSEVRIGCCGRDFAHVHTWYILGWD